MRRLWLLLLPCLFLPDLGNMSPSDVGTGEFADFLIGPYLLLTYLAGEKQGLGEWRRHRVLLIAFVAWALLSTLTINLRYGYSRLDYIQFGLVKVGKFVAYALAGLLTMRALERDRPARLLFPWAVLGACLVVSVSLILLRGSEVSRDAARVGFSSGNGMSVALAMMYCWMTGYFLSRHPSREWCVALGVAAPVLLVGIFFSDGRGGWVAGLIASGYIALRFGVRPPLIAAVLAGALTLVATYENESRFRNQVDMTLDPTRLSYQSEFAVSTGIDDGSRLEIWKNEAPKLANAPLLGTGFFHRGGYSGLYTSGSHNFWLEMFLETGVVGGVLVLTVIWMMWRAAGSRWPEAAGVGIPARAALIAAFIGGLGEGYFYGGKVLLTLFMVVAPVWSLPFEDSSRKALPARARVLSATSGTT